LSERKLPTATDADRQWWLERYTLDEVRELAEAIWPTETDERGITGVCTARAFPAPLAGPTRLPKRNTTRQAG
jgi:hypothetical protein